MEIHPPVSAPPFFKEVLRSVDPDLVKNPYGNNIHICPICLESPLHPALLIPCEHVICRECYDKDLLINCPLCRSFNDECNDDFSGWGLMCKAYYSAVNYGCPTAGCEFRGNIQQLQKHLGQCANRIVGCANKGCNEMMPLPELVDKHRGECMHRAFVCGVCKYVGPFHFYKFHRCPLKETQPANANERPGPMRERRLPLWMRADRTDPLSTHLARSRRLRMEQLAPGLFRWN